MSNRSPDNLGGQEDSEIDNSATEGGESESDEQQAESQPPQLNRQLVSSTPSVHHGKPLLEIGSLKVVLEHMQHESDSSPTNQDIGNQTSDDLESQEDSEIDNTGTEGVDDEPDGGQDDSQPPRFVPSTQPLQSGKPLPGFNTIRADPQILQDQPGSDFMSAIQGSDFRDSAGVGATYSEDPNTEHQGRANNFPRPNVVEVPEISVPSQSPSRSLTPLDRRQPSPSSQSGLVPPLPVISNSDLRIGGLSPASSSPGLLSPSTPPPTMFPSAKPSLTSFHKDSKIKYQGQADNFQSPNSGDAFIPSTGFGPSTEFGPWPNTLLGSQHPSGSSTQQLPHRLSMTPSETSTLHPPGPPTTLPPGPPPPYPFESFTPLLPGSAPPYPPGSLTSHPPGPPPPYPSESSTPLLPGSAPPYPSGSLTSHPPGPPPPYPSASLTPLLPRPTPSYPRPPHSGPSLNQGNAANTRSLSTGYCTGCKRAYEDLLTHMTTEHPNDARAAELNTPANSTHSSTQLSPPTQHPSSSQSGMSPPSAKMAKPSSLRQYLGKSSLTLPSREQILPPQGRPSGSSLPSSPSWLSSSFTHSLSPRQLSSQSLDQGNAPNVQPNPAAGIDHQLQLSSLRPEYLANKSKETGCEGSVFKTPSAVSAPVIEGHPVSQEAAEDITPADFSNPNYIDKDNRQGSGRNECACGHQTSANFKLRIHQKIHYEFYCRLCQTFYDSKEKLYRHREQIHDGNKKFRIECLRHCSLTFNSIRDFKSHVEDDVITTEKNYCPICGKFNFQAGNMRNHYASLGDEHYDDIPDIGYNIKNNQKKDDDGDGDGGAGAGGGQQLSVNYLEVNNNFQPLEKYFVDKFYDSITTEMEKMLKISSKSHSDYNKIGKEKGPHFVTEIQNTKQKLVQAKTLALTACSECNSPKLLKTKQRGKMRKNSDPRFFVCKKCDKRFRRKKLLKLHCSKFCHIKGHSCR